MSKGKALPLQVAQRVVCTAIGQLFSAIADKVFVAGSIRRGEKKVRDIDLVVVEPKKHGKIERTEFEGIPVQVFYTDADSLPFMLFHATGPAKWNIVNRVVAARQGLKLSQYGLFHRESGRRVAGLKSEEDIMRRLGRTVRPPERRA
jgi:DNA polymerase/3'-5' exonuclease PolX